MKVAVVEIKLSSGDGKTPRKIVIINAEIMVAFVKNEGITTLAESSLALVKNIKTISRT